MDREMNVGHGVVEEWYEKEGATIPSIPSYRRPMSMHDAPPVFGQINCLSGHTINSDRHIARDPRLRSFCVESVPSLIDAKTPLQHKFVATACVGAPVCC